MTLEELFQAIETRGWTSIVSFDPPNKYAALVHGPKVSANGDGLTYESALELAYLRALQQEAGDD